MEIPTLQDIFCPNGKGSFRHDLEHIEVDDWQNWAGQMVLIEGKFSYLNSEMLLLLISQESVSKLRGFQLFIDVSQEGSELPQVRSETPLEILWCMALPPIRRQFNCWLDYLNTSKKHFLRGYWLQLLDKRYALFFSGFFLKIIRAKRMTELQNCKRIPGGVFVLL